MNNDNDVGGDKSVMVSGDKGAKIMLTVAAVQALFPEGTEARTVLQRSVLDLMAKQFVKSGHVNGEILDAVNSARKHVVANALAELGIERGGRGFAFKYDPPEEIKTAVASSVINMVRAAVDDKARDSYKQRFKSWIEAECQRRASSAVAAEIQKNLAAMMRVDDENRLKVNTDVIPKVTRNAGWYSADNYTPKPSVEMLVTVVSEHEPVRTYVTSAAYYGTGWNVGTGFRVVAWMPKPEPYVVPNGTLVG